MSLVQKIRERGYWHLVIRPALFDPERVPYQELESIIRRTKVQLRGWDLPHIQESAGIDQHADSIGQSSEFAHHLESWRFFTTGQFIWIGGLRYDWREHLPPPLDPWTDERVLGVTDALWQYTEFFQFASRLAITAAGDEEVFVGISLHGLQGRSLKVDSPNRAPFVEDYRTQMEAFLYERTYHRSELVASHLDYARSAATDLFERFGWHPTAEILRGAQDELLRLH